MFSKMTQGDLIHSQHSLSNNYLRSGKTGDDCNCEREVCRGRSTFYIERKDQTC